jgi:KDO2-lipid IV(A) lauroyltransferase
MGRFRNLSEYACLRSAIAATSLVPAAVGLRLGAALGELVFRAVRLRRSVVEENLAATLGQFADARTLSRLAREIYRQLGMTLIEYGRVRRMSPAHIERMASVQGFDHLVASREAGRGTILLTGHFGNWELLGAVVALRGHPVRFVAKPQRNPLVDRFLQQTRAHLATGVVMTGGPGVREILRALRRNELIGMLADQDAGPGGLFLDVLGRTASVQTGPALFAVRSGAPIVPCYIVRRDDGRHDVSFEEALVADPSAPEEDEVERLTRACAASLERRIMRHPANWYWVHRRWKTRPPVGFRDGVGGEVSSTAGENTAGAKRAGQDRRQKE